MPNWLNSLLRQKSAPQWTSDRVNSCPELKVITEKDLHSSSHTAMPTTTTSTAADFPLPPPVLQSCAASTATRKARRKPARVGGLTVHWARFKKRIGTGTAPSSSSHIGESAAETGYSRRMEMALEANDLVDEVVVDRVWTEEIKSSVTHSDNGLSPEKSGGSHQQNHGASDHDSLTYEGRWRWWTPFAIIRYRTWPLLMEIFSSRFVDEKSEQHYAQLCSCISLSDPCALLRMLGTLVYEEILGSVGLSMAHHELGAWVEFPKPHPTMRSNSAIQIAPVMSIPVVFMVMYDWPRDRPYVYQVFLLVSIWCWSFYQVIYILSCGYYSLHPNCGSRDFLSTFYYTTALQTIALFGLKLNRFPAAIGSLAFFLFASISVIPVRRTWARSMINLFIFQSFLIYVHYMRESSERRLYRLRDQLKIQYKATQKAQINERKASDSKRRLTSYVFHDTSVFRSTRHPYAFHQVMRSLFVPLRLATDARGLKFETDLDPNIDKVARKATYEAMGEPPEAIREHMANNPDVEGVVTGDDARLRQIITNLASNACKFTPTGGKLTIRTRLVLPSIPAGIDPLDHDSDDSEKTDLDESENGQRPLSADYLSQHNMEGKSPAPLDCIVVRIEVSDTGYGIRPQDMAQTKLFSAFNQTEQGRQQGGKGTGLGLALVRQIVKLSGGRLGVKSKTGEGSTFWVELPLGVGRKTLDPGPPDLPDGSSTSDLDTLHRPRGGTRSKTKRAQESFPPEAGASVLRTSTRHSSGSAQTSAAMQGIMEQGGRVDLVLRKYGQNGTPGSTPLHDRDDPLKDVQITAEPETMPQSQSTSRMPKQPEKPPESSESTSTPVQPEPGASGISSPSESSRPTPVQRPTFVRLPSPQTFSIDDASPPTQIEPLASSYSNQSTTSERSVSNLKMFDNNFTRGSPSASFTTLNIEPNLPVLVVDDDPLTRTLMKRVLTRLGCQVSCAENGEVALEMILGQRVAVGNTPSSELSAAGPILEQQQEPPIFEEGKYAVVFLDNQMPVMSGLRVVEKLREFGRTDFIVGVTGNALLSDQEEYLEAGVDRVLTKPVLERSLRDILIQADERRKNRPEPKPPSRE
ncbi:unnamed protein product [Cyclocybe aegerita]|uniref:histidine kinase n=1 Tax=Cyclocybe aegerita TaxID=1973307 RepID=A0A8S0WCP7_CYCAE|nr:unnamed protein product [Cyclocybe aegerita]